ncbi:hypothetical protein [Roseomonas sp. BN140053]|uniref:hypothetical protein n=1 Tax=Roseomonas sp. BN140053 TaxID=3391898 RepID=UPI0039EAF78C
MKPYPSELVRALGIERFETSIAAEAAGVPAARLAQWLKIGAFELVQGRRPGTGRRNLFQLIDIYNARLFGALTDPHTGLALPLKVARDILLTAWTMGDESFSTSGMELHQAGVIERRRAALLRGVDLPPEILERDLKHPLWLVGSLVHQAHPHEASFWRGDFVKHLAHGSGNPLGKPRAFVALEATPHFDAADRVLFAHLGIVPPGAPSPVSATHAE